MTRRILDPADQAGMDAVLLRLNNVCALPGGRFETECPVCGLYGLMIVPRPGGYDVRCNAGCLPELVKEVICHRCPRAAQEGPTTVCLADVERKSVRWLWPGYIPYGMITLLIGDPGQGKGTLCIDLAARLSRGHPMPRCELATTPGNVLLLTTAEDDLATTIQPRLEAAGADLKRVHAFTDIVSLPGDVPLVEERIRTLKACLVVIDPLNAYLSAKVDSHVDQDVRRALSPLKVAAEATGAAVVIVGHLNKGGHGGPAIYRGGGSVGIAGAARAVFAVGTDSADAQRRVLAAVKCNIGQTPPAISFALEDDERLHVGRIAWGEVVTLTADEVLTWRPPAAREQRGGQAAEWYRARLGDGAWHLATDVEADQRAAGISTITSKRARKEVGVVTKRQGFGAEGVWYMGLPGASGPPFDGSSGRAHRVSSDAAGGIEYPGSQEREMILFGGNGPFDTLCAAILERMQPGVKVVAEDLMQALDAAGVDKTEAVRALGAMQESGAIAAVLVDGRGGYLRRIGG